MTGSWGLRERREALGWRQEDVAARADLSHTTVSNVERGRVAQRHVQKRVEAVLAAEEAARWSALEERRIAVQRGHAAAVPDSPEWAAFRSAVGQRAIDRLDAGDPEGCDLLLEFLPEAEAMAVLGDYFDRPSGAPPGGQDA